MHAMKKNALFWAFALSVVGSLCAALVVALLGRQGIDAIPLAYLAVGLGLVASALAVFVAIRLGDAALAAAKRLLLRKPRR